VHNLVHQFDDMHLKITCAQARQRHQHTRQSANTLEELTVDIAAAGHWCERHVGDTAQRATTTLAIDSKRCDTEQSGHARQTQHVSHDSSLLLHC
jgi:hypothetical protein